MSAEPRLRTAVVGTGFIAPQHVDAARRAGYADVVTLVGRDLERTRAAATTLGIPDASDDLDAILADASIDVVHVCTPNRTHVPLGIAVLDAGKHLVLEKPVAIDRAGAEALLAAVVRSGRHAAAALTYRGYPMVRRARDLVRSGEAGSIRLIHGAYIQDWLADARDYNWRLELETGGPSRAFGDIGTHWFDTVEFITGRRAEAVMAEFATFVPVRQRPLAATTAFGSADGQTEEVSIQTEDAATVLVRFDEGARGAVVVSQVSPGHKNALAVEIAGSERSLGWEQEDPERLWVRSLTSSAVLVRGPSGAAPTRGVPDLPGGHPEGWSEALRDLFRAFYHAVAAGDPPPVAAAEAPYPTLADGARGVALIEAVVTSAQGAGWVPVVPVEAATGAASAGTA